MYGTIDRDPRTRSPLAPSLASRLRLDPHAHTYVYNHTNPPRLHIIYPYMSLPLLLGTSPKSRHCVPLLQARPAKRIERRAPPRRLHKSRTPCVSGTHKPQ